MKADRNGAARWSSLEIITMMQNQGYAALKRWACGRWLPALLLLALVAPLARVHAEPGRVPEGLDDKNVAGTDLWIYNDIASALEAAKRERKPIFVTFRCVPCSACAGFDAEVAQGSEVIRDLAREHFISVRQVEMKGVDLSLFEFDYDLNWAAMFINADGVVYGRYGTQSAAGPDGYNSIASLQKAITHALALHEAYPENAAALAGKRGDDKPYKTALEMPGLEDKDRFTKPTARNNCIHCHNIHDAQQNEARRAGTFELSTLYRYPLPENVGLHIERDDGRRIAQVDANSPAARAGLRSGDDITHMAGQPIISIADMQWVLHHQPGRNASLAVKVQRDGKASTHTLTLGRDWKKTDFSWRGSMWSLKPAPGFWAEDLKQEDLDRLKLGEKRTALRVRWINLGRVEGRAARQAGLREGDIIMGMADQPLTLNARHFQAHVRVNYKVGAVLPLTVLRGDQRVELKLPLVE